MSKFIIRINSLDNIEKIENKYCLPKSYIYSLNKIENIFEGQWLYIEKIDCIMHIVMPFETIQSIAKKYNVIEEEILNFNNIEEIFIGMKLYIKKHDSE